MTQQQVRSTMGWVIGAAFLAVTVAVVAAFLSFVLRGPVPPPFEITHFAGKPEIFSPDKGWVPLQSSRPLGPNDKVRTDAASEVTLRIPDVADIRLKENSQLEGRKPEFLQKELTYRLHLLQGALQVSADKKLKEKGSFEVSTPVLVAAVRGTLFEVDSDPKKGKSSVNVLRGKVEVRRRSFFHIKKPVLVTDFEKVEMAEGEALPKPVKINLQDWDRIKTVYDLPKRGAAFASQQMDFSKDMGSLFGHVADYGTFYTPNFGHCEYEFLKDLTTGAVSLSVDYDVFPVGSFVGVYLKTRNLDFSKFDALEFQVQRNSDQGFPDTFRIEVKNKSDILRAMPWKGIKGTWQTVSVPLKFSHSIMITEITMVFTHETVGQFKSGSLLFRNFTLIPRSTSLPVEPAPTPPTAAKTIAISAVPTKTTPPATATKTAPPKTSPSPSQSDPASEPKKVKLQNI